MATNSNWTVIFEDRVVINQTVKNEDNHSVGYKVGEDSFWNDPKWSNVWAVQYKDDDHDYNDTVEYKDDTPHATWTEANLGDFKAQFVSKWDAAHLAQLQADWDADNVNERNRNLEKITRLGARPTTYSSY